MEKIEQKFTTKFQKWLKHMWCNGNAYFEIKTTKKNSLPFSAVKEHQLVNLQIKRVIHKFSDALQWGTLFDIILCEGVGYVVVNFNYPSKKFYIITVQTFIQESKNSERRSLTESRAQEISFIIAWLK